MSVTIVTEIGLALLWPMLAKRDSLKIAFWSYTGTFCLWMLLNFAGYQYASEVLLYSFTQDVKNGVSGLVLEKQAVLPGDLSTRLPLYSAWIEECPPYSHPNVGSRCLC